MVGVLSFNVASSLIPELPAAICTQYRLTLIPNPDPAADYSGCTFVEIVLQMGQKMGFGDAVEASQIRKFTTGSTLLTWNVKHFVGKVSFPVLTPAEWLQQQPPAGPTP